MYQAQCNYQPSKWKCSKHNVIISPQNGNVSTASYHTMYTCNVSYHALLL